MKNAGEAAGFATSVLIANLSIPMGNLSIPLGKLAACPTWPTLPASEFVDTLRKDT